MFKKKIINAKVTWNQLETGAWSVTQVVLACIFSFHQLMMRTHNFYVIMNLSWMKFFGTISDNCALYEYLYERDIFQHF